MERNEERVREKQGHVNMKEEYGVKPKGSPKGSAKAGGDRSP